MAILDNYMFRPLLAIFRLSSRKGVFNGYNRQLHVSPFIWPSSCCLQEKVYLMAILDNYMFRPLLAIFRLSLREGVFNGYTRQLHVSAFTGHLQVVFKRRCI